MFDLYLQGMGNISIHVTSDSDISWNEKNILLLHAYIPSIKISESTIENPLIMITHKESGERGFYAQGNNIVINDTRNGEFSFDMYHLLYSIVHERLLQNKIYSVHATCVLYNSKRILLVGHSGVGKSTISLELAKVYSMSIITGNKTLVSFTNKLQCLGGTTTMTLPKKYSDIYVTEPEGVDYYDRIAFSNPSLSSISLLGDIDMVILPLLNNHEDCFEKIPSQSALHKLYSYFIDSVYKDTVMCGGAGVYVANYGNDVSNTLTHGLQKVLSTIPVYKVNGSKEYISSTIVSLGSTI